MKEHQVHIWEETVTIPTYETGEPNRNPMFLEKRVYQGSSGAVYPHPVIDKIKDHKVDKEYEVVFLENDYLKIMVMPSLGGRVQMAYDKKHDYHFVYYNQVIKPALVGLAGPWISGGIEFNWPQHHRPSTFDPVDHTITTNEDGSMTLWVSEVELMTRTKGMAGFTLYPDRSYLEIKAQIYNRTDEPKTFLWWANPALAVHDQYQSIFPPDVHAVMDHGKRDVSKFPIADGTYYKMDYSAGVDISRYKNLKVPTSYMVHASDYDFIGGYDHARAAGMLHVADHHVVPGKKQWVWGSGDFGIAWDRNLTDEDGPYAELMTGAFTDNQPDFTWLQPYEEKQFTQYFMPYYGIGAVQQADKYRALSLEQSDTTVSGRIYVSTAHEHITLRISARTTDTNPLQTTAGTHEITLAEETISLAAQQVHTLEAVRPEGMSADALIFGVYKDEVVLLSYTQETEPAEVQLPEPATAAAAPQEIEHIEELFITGLHIEQYRHATRRADDYYREALTRDPSDSRCCTALGRRLIARGRFAEAEALLRRAVERLTSRNPNPYDGGPVYHLGRALLYQQRYDEAYRCFYKAIWCDAQKSSGFYHLALIDCRRGEYTTALEHLQQSLDSGYRNHTARNLASAVLRALNRTSEAKDMLRLTRSLDRGDWGSLYELSLRSDSTEGADELRRLMRASDNNYLELSLDYSRAGLLNEALHVLELLIEQKPLTKCSPLISYHRAYLLYRLDKSRGAAAYQAAQGVSPHGCFPSKLESLLVLQEALEVHPEDARAHYYLGNAHYALQNYEEAMGHWEQSIALDSSFPTAHRNLALAYMNKRHDQNKCELLLTRAFDLDTSDARVLYELDQFRKITNVSPQERIESLQALLPVVTDRDDLYLEYITLLNQQGRYQEALSCITGRQFHPWEGGEGKVPAQYKQALTGLALQSIAEGAYTEACAYLQQCRTYPHNLGEGKLFGTQEQDIDYLTGLACERAGDSEQAVTYYTRASEGKGEPVSALYYNDQPPHMIYFQARALEALGRDTEARKRYETLYSYGTEHLRDHITIDYFAVSLPDFLVFEQDLEAKNTIHCLFMQYLGSQDPEAASQIRDRLLSLDVNHIAGFISRIDDIATGRTSE